MLADLTLRAGSEITRAAVVVDVREGKLLTEFPAIYRKLQDDARPGPGADLPRGLRGGAGPALQRDAAAASARAGSVGDRRASARSARRCAPSAAWPITSSTLGHDGARAAARVHQRRQRARARHAAGGDDPELRLQARHPGGLGSAVRRPLPAESALRAEAAAAHRARSRRRADTWSGRTRRTTSCATR